MAINQEKLDYISGQVLAVWVMLQDVLERDEASCKKLCDKSIEFFFKEKSDI